MMASEKPDHVIVTTADSSSREDQVIISILDQNLECRLSRSEELHSKETLHHRSRTHSEGQLSSSQSFKNTSVVVLKLDNDIEAHRISNNYLEFGLGNIQDMRIAGMHFGFKKWKSHVTARPLENRSEIVQDLYADLSKVKPIKVSTVRPTNILYTILVGWWLASIYLIISVLMGATYFGRAYAPFCWRMAGYFFWPFGKFVYHLNPHGQPSNQSSRSAKIEQKVNESTSLLSSQSSPGVGFHFRCEREYWCNPRSYVWLVLGAPVLIVVHIVLASLAWLLVITIPMYKVNKKTIWHLMFLPPEQVGVGNSSAMTLDTKQQSSEIIMYTHQAVNIYYYKYTVDGMNVILLNLLVFVFLSLVIGFADPENKSTSGVSKCVLAVLAVIPLTYYLGMAIISISAQSSFTIGALLNATFGSIVELILYIVALNKGRLVGSSCYAELVRSGLTGTILGSILFIPGVCMVVGGLKYQMQSFNRKSASVTALLLFVAVGGVFAPTLFSKILESGDIHCTSCESVPIPSGKNSSMTFFLNCTYCSSDVTDLDGNKTLYTKHIEPVVYGCAIILPIAYIVGVLYTLKTHTSYVYDEFNQQQQAVDGHQGHTHGAPQWSRVKSVIILLVCAVLIALCSDLITDNIQYLINSTGVSEYFIGVTMIAMVPALPEIVNGIQFALQNNVNLGIEIGTSIAIQVCLIQVPVMILVNVIEPQFNFISIFHDVHLWSVIFSVVVINYTFQDGKSDYFQGSVLVAIYLLLMCVYYFTPTPKSAKC